jgi:NAD(P)-dependent dehydrogenase (short-subunit alcohol dehydrogenase family)
VGRATARAFAAKGASIALLARGEAGLDATRRELKAEGARVLAIQADVADADAVERAARKSERKLGPIDVWVNNAMTSVFACA